MITNWVANHSIWENAVACITLRHCKNKFQLLWPRKQQERRGGSVQSTRRWVSCISIYKWQWHTTPPPTHQWHTRTQTWTIVLQLSQLGHWTTNESTAEGHIGVIIWLIDKCGPVEERYNWGTKAQLNKPGQQTTAVALMSESLWQFVD